MTNCVEPISMGWDEVFLIVTLAVTTRSPVAGFSQPIDEYWHLPLAGAATLTTNVLALSWVKLPVSPNLAVERLGAGVGVSTTGSEVGAGAEPAVVLAALGDFVTDVGSATWFVPVHPAESTATAAIVTVVSENAVHGVSWVVVGSGVVGDDVVDA